MPAQIQIPRGSPRVQYVADGSQTAFTYAFPIFKTEDLEVWLAAARQSTGYTITGAGTTVGGTVTFTAAPAADTVVTLRRRVPIERLTDFLESGPLSAQALNTEFDLLTACLQQVGDDQALMLRYADTDLPASAVVPDRAVRAGRLLGFDGTGNPAVSDPVDTDALQTYVPPGAGAAPRAIADKLTDIVSVRDFGATGDGVVDDTLAFQSALTAADAVYVPAGRYRLTNTLTIGYGQTLAGVGQASVLVADTTAFDLIHLPDGYATVRSLRLERGLAGVRLFGRDGPCVQNTLEDLTVWDPVYGLVFDGYDRTDRPCYWNHAVRVLIARPTTEGVWMTRSGAGDTPNANKFLAVRVYSLGSTLTGSGFYVEHGRYNNAFIDCEANIHPNAHSCFRLGAATDKTLIVNLYCESLGAVPNVRIEAGSIETAIVNLFSAAAGPAIQDLSGGQYTAFNAGYPEKNRMRRTRITELTVEALRYDTEFHDPPAGGLFEPDLTSSIYLVSAFNGEVEVRLPAASGVNGHAVTIKKTDSTANLVRITEAGGNGPDGRTTVLGSQYDFVTVISNGAAWWITNASRMPGNTQYHETAGLYQPDLARDFYAVSAWAGAVEVRLPTASAAHAVGRTVTVKKVDSSGNAVTVTASSGTGPDNEAIPLTAFGHAVTALSNGGSWYIVARNP